MKASSEAQLPWFERLAIRPGAVFFLCLLIIQFIVTRVSIRASYAEMPSADTAFSGVIIDPGVASTDDKRSGRSQTIRLENKNLVLLWMNEPGRRGDRVTGRAAFFVPSGTRNPGGFSRRNYLLSKGVVWDSRVRSVSVTPKESITLSLRRLPDRLRDLVRRRGQRLWDASGGALLLSLAVGDTDRLSECEQYELKSAGLSHLTSVSGTHLLFITGPTERLMKKLRLSARTRTIMMVFFILLPGVLSGWKSGISRASLLAFCRQADRPLMKHRESYNALFFVGGFMLLWHPYALYDIGFWMSLMTAGAISVVNDREEKKTSDRQLEKWLRACRQSFYFSMAAQVAILPYQMMSSPGIHLLAPLANVIALPLASLLMAATYLCLAVLLPLSPASAVAGFLIRLFTLCLAPVARLFQSIAGAITRMRLAFIPLRYILVCLPFLMLVMTFKKRPALVKQYKKTLLSLSLTLFIFLWLIFFSSSTTSVLFLDVGQGDATMITNRGRAILIDGGDEGHGYRTVIPAARMQAITIFDLAIITHAHSDHASGVMELMESGMVRALCMPISSQHSNSASSPEEDMSQAIIALAEQRAIPLRYLKAGDRLNWRSVVIEVLSPDETMPGDLNDRSLVLACELDTLRLLMTGDLTEAGERRLMRHDAALQSDLLHVAHHGSRFATGDGFLTASAPQSAVISVGANNRYGHPHDDVLRRLDEHLVNAFRTDESGCVFLNIRRGKGTMKTWIRR